MVIVENYIKGREYDFSGTKIMGNGAVVTVKEDGTYSLKSNADSPGLLWSGELTKKWQDSFPMVQIEGGTFMMGDTFGDGEQDEKPTHQVTVRGFYMGKYEVTFDEYDAFCEVTGCEKPKDNGWGRGKQPVINVSWDDAVEYCNWLSGKEGLRPAYAGSGESITCDFTADGYRLPTEAEWEYAAKGGASGRGYKYAGGNDPDSVAWYDKNSGGKTQPVGGRRPNELGLYDMSGNAWEWCWDWYGKYESTAQTDPRGPSSGDNRVIRGGCWGFIATNLRSANRFDLRPEGRIINLGFRVLRP